MTPHFKSQLLDAFKTRAFCFGNFVLKSGKETSYYVNSKKAMFSSAVSGLLSEALWSITRDLQIDAAGGLEMGAIPLATLMAERYNREGLPLEGFVVRNHAKDHGSGDKIEGNLQPGMRAVILDDVLTTGQSALQAIAAVESIGVIVAAVVCIVDRLEGAREAIGPRHDLRSIFTIRDFGIESR